jgi:hypothetical protein
MDVSLITFPYEAIWEILFQDIKVVDECSKVGLNLIILGSDLPDIISTYRGETHCPTRPKDSTPELILAALNTNKRQLSKAGWHSFRTSLHPHSYDEGKYEINFTSLNVKLNIHSLIYNTLHQDIFVMEPERLFWRYFKSGLFEVISTCATMYKGHLEMDYGKHNKDQVKVYSSSAILEHSIPGAYRVELKYCGRLYHWALLPLWWA